MFKLLVAALIAVLTTSSVSAQALIRQGVTEISVSLGDQVCTIGRTQTKGNTINPFYAVTTHGRPQPMSLAPGIETLGELEFIDYMQRAGTDDTILVIDTRTETWHRNLAIPCTANIPYTLFNDDRDFAIIELLDSFGVTEKDDGSLDFSRAKTVVGYCNGFWCGQTPAMFKNAKFSLSNLGYPAKKLKYYRGGMQAWTALGLSVVGDLK